MKQFIFFLLFYLFFNTAFSQKFDVDSASGARMFVIQNFKSAAEKLLKEYDEKPETRITSPKTFRSIFSEVFSNIITGSNAVAKNSTALTYSQDKEIGSLGVNYAHFNDRQTIYNYGLVAQTTGSVFNIYSSNNWNNGIGVSVGASSFFKNTLFFSREDSKVLAASREKFLNRLVMEYAQLLILRDELKIKYSSLQKEDVSFSVVRNSTGQIMSTAKYYDSLRIVYDLLDSLDRRVNVLTKELAKGSPDYANFYEEKLSTEIMNFELRTKKDWKYSIHWISGNISFGQSSSKIYNDTLIRDSVFIFDSKDFFRFRISGTYNYTRNNIYLTYFSTGLSLYNTNYLEGRNLKQIPFVSYDTIRRRYAIFTDAKSVAGNVEDYKSRILILAPSVNYAVFFGSSKTVGIQLLGTVKFVVAKPSEIDYPHTFDGSAGVVFHIKKDEHVSKGTISAEAGLYNARFGTRIWNDAFALRLKVGIPFMTFLKKDEK